MRKGREAVSGRTLKFRCGGRNTGEMAMTLDRYWSKITKTLEPYTPGEQPKSGGYIKLNTNENPFPPSVHIIEAINSACLSLNLYPPPEADALCEKIASYFALSPEMVFVGNGSDEILAFCFPAFFERDKEILFNDITYSFYEVYARFYSIPFRLVPLDEDFTTNAAAFCKPNNGILIANPNAPTGIALPPEEVEDILKNNPQSLVILDEAYIDFGGKSAFALLPQYENLLIVQSLSKSRSLAGLRVGFALGNVGLISALKRIKNSFNSYTLDRLAIAGAIAAFEDNEYFLKTCKEIIAIREQTANALETLGFRVLPSSANFLFVSHEKLAASLLYEKLKGAGILVRYFDKPRLHNFLRITIGTAQDMRDLIVALRLFIGSY